MPENTTSTESIDRDVEKKAGNTEDATDYNHKNGPSPPETSASKPEEDPNAVFWDGPADPENPMNWPERKKWINIAVLATLTIITPLGSSMFAPGIPKIMVEFQESNQITATFILSVYILGFVFGPLLVAPLSEIYGRVPLYNYGNVLFTIFTVGTALSRNVSMLMAFRFLMGLAGSVPVTIGSGSIADIMPIEKRGRAMSAWAMGPLLGPCVGPVAGGYLIEAAGWRWVYWLLAILGGVFSVVSFLTLRESYAPVVLERRAARLRKQTGNALLRSKLDEGTIKEKFRMATVRPLKLLFVTPIVTLMALYCAVTYGIMYLLLTTFSFVYAEKYGFGEGVSGLTFLPAGIGMMIGVLTFGQVSDLMVNTNTKKGLEHRPEIRLSPLMTVPCGVMLPVGLFIYGWTTEKAVFWIVPMIGVVIFTAGLMGVMACIQNYLLDCYPKYAASVTAALAVLRSLAGALLPLGGLNMYNSLGLGWGNSLLAFISLALVPIPVAFYIYGPRLRARFMPNL